MSNDTGAEDAQPENSGGSGGDGESDDGGETSGHDAETIIDPDADSPGDAGASPDRRGSELDEREASLDRREAELDDRAAELEKEADRLDQREDGLDTRATDLRERAELLDEREGDLEDWQAELEEKRDELIDRESAIADRESELDEREAAIADREAELDDRAAQLDRKEQTLQEYVGDQVTELEGSVAETVRDAVDAGLASRSNGGSRLGTVGNLLLGLVGISLVVGGVVNYLLTGVPGIDALFDSAGANTAVSAILVFFGLAANLTAAANRV